MMKKLILLITTALSLSITISAQAHCGTCEKTKEGETTKKCDTEKCEKTAAENEAKLAEMFSKHDADKDGKLSLVEFKALTADCKSKQCDSKKAKQPEEAKKTEETKPETKVETKE